jgi:CHAP domain
VETPAVSKTDALLAFITAEVGKAGAGTNSVNRGQCTGLVALWLAAEAKPAIFADGKDMLTAADPAVYTVTQNSPKNFPSAGDVVSWNESFGAGHGHTAIAVQAGELRLVVFEQNNPDGAAPRLAVHGYTAVQGWLSW